MTCRSSGIICSRANFSYQTRSVSIPEARVESCMLRCSVSVFPPAARSFIRPVKRSASAAMGRAGEYPNEGIKLADTQSKASEENSPLNPLLQPWQLGQFELAHRLVYAPLTRCRAIDTIPQPAAAEYYSQRATGGLIINEATCVAPEAHGKFTCNLLRVLQARTRLASQVFNTLRSSSLSQGHMFRLSSRSWNLHRPAD